MAFWKAEAKSLRWEGLRSVFSPAFPLPPRSANENSECALTGEAPDWLRDWSYEIYWVLEISGLFYGGSSKSWVSIPPLVPPWFSPLASPWLFTALIIFRAEPPLILISFFFFSPRSRSVTPLIMGVCILIRLVSGWRSCWVSRGFWSERFEMLMLSFAEGLLMSLSFWAAVETGRVSDLVSFMILVIRIDGS